MGIHPDACAVRLAAGFVGHRDEFRVVDLVGGL